MGIFRHLSEALLGRAKKGDGGVSDKTRWEGRGQQLHDSRRGTRALCRALGPAKENIYALESLKGDIV
jgi:hypothetical protein